MGSQESAFGSLKRNEKSQNSIFQSYSPKYQLGVSDIRITQCYSESMKTICQLRSFYQQIDLFRQGHQCLTCVSRD
jgi:hypothetical protein